MASSELLSEQQARAYTESTFSRAALPRTVCTSIALSICVSSYTHRNSERPKYRREYKLEFQHYMSVVFKAQSKQAISQEGR